jgi:predicted permease
MGNFISGKSDDCRLKEEIELHLALQTEENVRVGMGPEEARRQAVLKFGAVASVREEYHAERGLPLLEELVQDTRYALRMMRKSPQFTLVAVATLALGIGANVAIFTLVNAIMLKRLPVADPKTLVRLGEKDPCCVGIGIGKDGDYALFSTDSYENLRKNIPEFADLAAMQAGFTYRPVVARRDGTQETARSVAGEFVSGNYFRTFGLNARSGRLLLDSDDVAGAPMRAVMSYESWKTRYNGDLSVVGSTFRINTRPVTVVGIAPEGYYGDRLSDSPPEFYLPIETMPEIAHVPYVHNSDQQWLYLIGRARPGVLLTQLQQKVNTILRQQLLSLPLYNSEDGKLQISRVNVPLTPGGGGVRTMEREYDRPLVMLMCASGLLLLIACANIANLLLVRGMGRKAEINLRTALGARRGRIARQLLAESLLLAGLGGLVGLAVAYGGTRMLLTLEFPHAQQIPIHASPSGEVLAFAFGASLLTGLLFGLAPMLVLSRAEPAESLRGGTRAIVGGASLLQGALVIAQASLSLILLVGAGLFTESLNKLEHIDLKLEANNRYIAHIKPQSAGYSQQQLGEFYRVVVERLHAISGVEKVGIASYTPMEDDNDSWSVVVQGKPDPHLHSAALRASPEYFDSVGTRLLIGRGIEATDTASSTPVAVVNESFVKKLFKPGENPIGQHFGGDVTTAGDYQIVGVVDDTAYTDARWKDHLMFFAPLLQRVPSNKQPIEKDESLYSGAIVLETNRKVPDMEVRVRKTLVEINPNLALLKFQRFTEQISDQFSDQRMLTQLTTMFGVLALLLAALGLYGVTAYTVARRTAEIGIRMAVGAPRAHVIAMVMRGVFAQTVIALFLGAPVAMICVRFVQSQLYEITSVGASVMMGAISTLVVTALAAGAIPARKAASIDPAQTLKAE